MRTAFSNLAWDIEEDAQVAALLSRHDVDAIDVAVGKYFPQPAAASEPDIAAVRRFWAERGVAIIGVQSLLFGCALNLFHSDESRNALILRLSEVCRIAAGLGAARLVFGSYRNRDRGTLDDGAAAETAAPFFRRLGDIAAGRGLSICLEAVPSRCGANFMTTTAEAASIVRQVNHAAVRLQLDTGTIAVNGESLAGALDAYGELIGHVHVSEPDLAPLGLSGLDHRAAGAMLKQRRPDDVATMEMLAAPDEPHIVALERALQKVVPHYL